MGDNRNNQLITKIYKDLRIQMTIVKSENSEAKYFVKEYKIDTRNFNEKKGDFYYFIKEKLNNLLKKQFNNEISWCSYKETYVFSNNRDLLNKRILELVKNDK